MFWNIGRGIGTVVLAGDVAKGSAAIVIAGLLGLPWPLTLLVGGRRYTGPLEFGIFEAETGWLLLWE